MNKDRLSLYFYNNYVLFGQFSPERHIPSINFWTGDIVNSNAGLYHISTLRGLANHIAAYQSVKEINKTLINFLKNKNVLLLLPSERRNASTSDLKKMHSFGYRANALLTFAVTILAFICAIASFSDNFSNQAPSAQIQVSVRFFICRDLLVRTGSICAWSG